MVVARNYGPDLAALGLLLLLGWYFLPPFSPGSGPPPVVELPFWATGDDLLLVGPDAGEWASGAHKVAGHDFVSLDVHRMPTWQLLTGLLLYLQPDVALAGHLLNHLFQLLLPLVLFGLGRLGGSRWVGLGAGFMVALCGPLVNASRLYGVDPAIAFFLPAAMLATASLRHCWQLAPLAGALTGLAALCHYTSLPLLIPASLLAILRGPRGWWRRLLAVLLHAGGAALAIWCIDLYFPLPTPREWMAAASEGVAPQNSGGARTREFTEQALAVMRQGAGTAMNDAAAAVSELLRPGWMPWGLVLVLPWIGVLGMGLGQPPPDAEGAAWWKRLWWRTDPALGLCLLLLLAPLPVFQAASAPERYGWNLLPIAALLIMRGLGSLGHCVDLLLRRAWGRWPLGALASLLALAVMYEAWTSGHGLRNRLPPLHQGLEVRMLGDAIRAHFDPGGDAVCQIREASAHAGRSYCPFTPCPFGKKKSHFRQCLEVIAKECAGEGPIPYVVLRDAENLPHVESQEPTAVQSYASPERAAMDAWLLESHEPLEVVRGMQFTALLLALPRPEE